jgi:hypothetical protein
MPCVALLGNDKATGERRDALVQVISGTPLECAESMVFVKG